MPPLRVLVSGSSVGPQPRRGGPELACAHFCLQTHHVPVSGVRTYRLGPFKSVKGEELVRRSMRAVRAAVVVFAVAGLTLEACDGAVDETNSAPDGAAVSEDAEPESAESEGEENVGPEEPDEADEPDGPDDAEEAQEAQADDDAAAVVSGGTAPVAEGDLPGEDAALYFAEQGEVVHVVGVDHAEQLPVRGLPDPSAVEVGQLDPMADVTLAGRERVAGDGAEASRWVEVELSGGVGWVDGHHLGFIELYAGSDSLAEYDGYGAHPEPIGTVSEASRARVQELSESGQQLEAVLVDGRDGSQLAQARGAEPPLADVRQDRGAQVWSPGDVLQVQPAFGGPDPDNLWTIDFLGFADDAIRGQRVELFVAEMDEGYEVVGAWTWNICARGVTEDGSCV